MCNSGFRTLNSRQCRTVISETGKTNEEKLTITPAYCLNRVSRLQCREGEPRWSLTVILHRRDRAGGPRRSRCPEFTGQRERESCAEIPGSCRESSLSFQWSTDQNLHVRKLCTSKERTPKRTEGNIFRAHTGLRTVCIPTSQI